ncbi:MAG: endospore germination permease [Clostridiaceae bacterium]|jgi:spore germination protein (amino acid permease)|nr:endospore germination permease [Clostridiaceae bacterium]
MKTGQGKISVKQLFFVFTIMVSSPATRLLPKYAAAKAEQAGWVSPIISTVPFILLILVIDSLLKKYKGQSMPDIINNILGKFLGKLVLVVYLLWTLWLTAMYTRYYTERLTSSIYPNMSISVFIILSLIPIAYILRSGFTVIARMSEILLPFIGAMLIMLAAFSFPKVRADNLLPVYFNDIVPIFKGSIAITGILSYLFLMFFLSDNVVNLKSLRRFGYIAAYVNISSIMVVNTIVIGVLSSSLARRVSMPVLTVVKQISIMDIIENIEAIVIAIWIFADFTMISTLLVIAMKLFKSIFKLSDTKPLIDILAVLTYFLSMGICARRFELEDFTNNLLMPINLILGYGFPFLLFVLSKLKKKKQPESSTDPPQ